VKAPTRHNQVDKLDQGHPIIRWCDTGADFNLQAPEELHQCYVFLCRLRDSHINTLAKEFSELRFTTGKGPERGPPWRAPPLDPKEGGDPSDLQGDENAARNIGGADVRSASDPTKETIVWPLPRERLMKDSVDAVLMRTPDVINEPEEQHHITPQDNVANWLSGLQPDPAFDEAKGIVHSDPQN
jgi:hypothetical protein